LELHATWVVFFTPMVGCAGNFQEEPYMKRTFLISTATAALVAGTVLAAAQGTQKQAPASGAMDRGAAQSETQRGSDNMQSEDRKGREEGRKGERRGQAQGEKREPKTTGQSQGQEQRQQSQQGQKGEQSPPRASEQGQSKQQSKQQQTQERQGERKEDAKDQGREGQNERREGQSERREGARQESGKSSVSFTTEQRTKIRETVLRGGNAPRVSKVDFSVRVGTVVPSSVHVVTVPDVIVEVHPEWRGFYYFVYNEEIVILDRDHNIVAIVEV
jgi:hypothetical protein